MKKPNTTNNGAQETKKRDYLENADFAVSAARVWSNGGVSFNLMINGVNIYGCRVVEGKNGDFISFPARKGGDGKYYHHAYVSLGSELEKEILAAVEAQINGNS